MRWCLFTFCEFVRAPSFRGSFRHLLLRVVVVVMVVNVEVVGSNVFCVCVWSGVCKIISNSHLYPCFFFPAPLIRYPESSLQQLSLLSLFHFYCLPHSVAPLTPFGHLSFTFHSLYFLISHPMHFSFTSHPSSIASPSHLFPYTLCPSPTLKSHPSLPSYGHIGINFHSKLF